MVYETVMIEDGKTVDETIEHEARTKFSRAIHISRVKDDKKIKHYQFGVTIPKVIVDVKQPPLIKYISINEVFSISAEIKKDKIQVDWPERNEISVQVMEKKRTLIHRAENALMSCFGDQLIQIPKVQNGLNPIKEILLALSHLGEIPRKELNARRHKSRSEEYLKFLESLDYVRCEGEMIYPGDELSKYDLADVDDKEANTAILQDVLLNGFRYLRENLKIYILTPYLEFSSAYYLQSYLAEQILHLDHNEIGRHYTEMYERSHKKPPYQIYSNLIELSEAGILQADNDSFFGHQTYFTKFQETFTADI